MEKDGKISGMFTARPPDKFLGNVGIKTTQARLSKIKVLDATAPRYSAISAALKRGKEVVGRGGENALFKRAFDFEYTEQTVKVVDRDKDVIESEQREFENRYSMRVLVYLV